MVNDLKICFYMPSRIVGGCEFLFLRIADYLAQNVNNKVYYIDYKDGFVKKTLKKTNVKFINYSDNKKIYKIEDNCIVITPITLAFNLPIFKNQNIKFLFWNLHPENINWLKNTSKMSFSQVANFLKLLSNTTGLLNQDIVPYSKAKTYYEKCSKNYLPALLNNSNFRIKKSLIKPKELNLTWLGRLDNDKIYSLINLLDNLKNIQIDKKIKMHIIGDGNAKEKINLDLYKDYMDIDFTGVIIGDELNTYLQNNTDILFGMGISMVEAEKLGIPAVLTFLTFEKVNTNEFVFTKDLPYALVGCDYKFNHVPLRKKSIEEVLEALVNETEILSIASRKNFEENFLIDNKIECLINYCNNCIFTQEQLLDFKKNVKNNNKISLWDCIVAKFNKTVKKAKRIQRATNKRILIFASSYSFYSEMRQRPNHLFESFIKDNYVIFWSDKNVKRPIEVEKNIWLYPMKDTASLILNNKVKDKLVMSISTHYTFKNLGNLLIKADNKGIPVIFEHLDDIDLVTNSKTRFFLEKRFKKICSQKSILISTTADSLYNQAKLIRKSGENIIIAKNGVNLNDFIPFSYDEKFSTFLSENKPIIGYYGCISSAWFDFELIEYCLQNLPEFNFILIGPHLKKDINKLNKYSNFLCLDKMDYKNLKNYSIKFTVGIIPFILNNITKGTSPCKMFEYMALGLPIVVTNLPECYYYKSCLIANNKYEFVDLLKKAIKLKDDIEYQKTLQLEAKNNSYESVYNIIKNGLTNEFNIK